ncbi:MAG: hypothetical protein ABF649_19795 [Bacillus sp. (in: firmicutes)]
MEDRLQQFNQFVEQRKASTEKLITYWHTYSDIHTWQFWFILAMLIIPLIILYMKIDRTKIFHICFYGYTIHLFFSYMELIGINKGKIGYAYQIFPQLPSFSLDSSLIPVAFMLVYQWTLNHQKNYFLYTIVTAIIFSFLFKPFLACIGILKLYNGFNFLDIFWVYLLALFIGKIFVSLFLKLQKPVND